MDFIKFSISKPVSVAVGVILVVLFGLVGLRKLPVQLTPDVETPQITVTTVWPGAAPYEVEKDIIEEQENVLKGIQRLTLMESSSFNAMGEITLTFEVGTDIDAALLRVSNKLNEVRRYPQNVEKPVITASGAQSSPVIWMVLMTRKGPPQKIDTYRTFFENEVRQHLERVPGVGSLFVFGGSEKQLEVLVSPQALARHELTISRVVSRLQTANRNVSAGLLGMDKMNYRIRTVSQFQHPAEALDILLENDGFHRVSLRDVAEARMGYATNDTAVMHNGTPVIVVGVRKEQGANVIALTRRMQRAVKELNAGLLADNNLRFKIVYEQTPYIFNAISIVRRNVIVGGLLAMGVLLLFLRSVSSTLVTALAIPISVIGTFVFMWIFDRSLNVVSLAGISFAVGMLVDNAIVVLENIDRHRSMGKSPFAASLDGTREVWGAVLASTATTVAVFLPVIFIQEEAGQLFKDIAIAITFAIFISLLVSVSVIPTMTHLFYRLARKKAKKGDTLGRFGGRVSDALVNLSRLSIRNTATRLATVVILTGAACLTAWLLVPKAEYLPQGNRNLILNILIPPPGYSITKRRQLGAFIFKATRPYYESDFKDGIPRIKDIFFVSSDRMTLFGAISAHETRAREMMPLFTRIIHRMPGIYGVSIQSGIFQNSIGRGRTVEVDISGRSVDTIIQAARTLFGAIRKSMPGAQVRPVPSLENSYPEVNFLPDRSRVVANGLTEEEVGLYVDVILDGRKVGEYKPEQAKKIDLVLRSDPGHITAPEDIADSPIANGYGKLIRIADVARLQYSQGMTQIDHLERRRNIKLEVTPSRDVPLQAAMETIQRDIIGGLNKAGKLSGVSVTVGGNADKLSQALAAMQWYLLLSTVIIYLLMAALFENFFYPLIILFSVPLAGAGGFLGLDLVNRFIAPQSFDIVTMLGFVILVGTVVNNAILIVHQALNNVRYNGLSENEAILESVRTRIRPIFMSATTSLFGMLPLVLSTGPGSELYRGLGSVLLGGLAVSTVFTLFVVPALLSFFIGFERDRRPQADGPAPQTV